MKDNAEKALKAFMVWWLGELGSMVPARLKAVLFRRSAELCMVPDAAHLAFFLRDDKGLNELAEIGLEDGSDAIGRQGEEILAKADGNDRSVTILLPDYQVLRSRVELPVDAADNLDEVLASEMDRHTPFSAEEVHFDYRVLGVDPDLERLSVELLVARKADIERAVEFARLLGLDVKQVTALDIAWAQNDFSLLSHPKNGLGPRQWRQAAIAATAVVFLAVSVFLPLERKAKTVEALEAEVASLREGAAQAAELERRTGQLSESSDYVVNAKHQRLNVVALLDEVTRRMPDGSWLTKLTVRRGEVAITGYSGDPSSVLRRLEDSALLQEAKFSAPVTHDAKLETDRFQLKAKVTREAGS